MCRLSPSPPSSAQATGQRLAVRARRGVGGRGRARASFRAARTGTRRKAGVLCFLASGFLPDEERLRAAATAYLAEPTAQRVTQLHEAAEPPRQELLRRMNMAPGGTAALVAMRKEILARLRTEPELGRSTPTSGICSRSWFNRGFLEVRRIDWQTPAAVLEKLIAYEAVHEIQGWDDLRRRLAPDRRCFAFFHPALPGEPLIFVEVALTRDWPRRCSRCSRATTMKPPGARGSARRHGDLLFDLELPGRPARRLVRQFPDQAGGRGAAGGAAAALSRFSTLSPVPGFRRWLETARWTEATPTRSRRRRGRSSAPRCRCRGAGRDRRGARLRRDAARRCCCGFAPLSHGRDRARPVDPVARFHLGNGARLERINWLGNISPRGIRESYGIMVNYLYDPEAIEANHEAFAPNGAVVRSAAVDELLAEREPPDRQEPRARPGPAPGGPQGADHEKRGHSPRLTAALEQLNSGGNDERAEGPAARASRSSTSRACWRARPARRCWATSAPT